MSENGTQTTGKGEPRQKNNMDTQRSTGPLTAHPSNMVALAVCVHQTNQLEHIASRPVPNLRPECGSGTRGKGFPTHRSWLKTYSQAKSGRGSNRV